MNTYKKIANAHHEEESRWTSRDFGGRISKRTQRAKKIVNRIAKREESRLAFKDECNSDGA